MSDCDVGLRQGQHDAVESRIEVGVWVPCDWLPGFAWVHWATRDLAFALAFCWHVVGCAICGLRVCGTVFLLLRCYVGVCVAVFDLCARLQAVVQEVWEPYFSGLAACVD